MYVCICKAVSEKDVLHAIEKGVRTLKEIQKNCGAGTDCGACCSKVNAILDKTIQAPCMHLPKASSE